jgi:hypothetical protein
LEILVLFDINDFEFFYLRLSYTVCLSFKISEREKKEIDFKRSESVNSLGSVLTGSGVGFG